MLPALRDVSKDEYRVQDTVCGAVFQWGMQAALGHWIADQDVALRSPPAPAGLDSTPGTMGSGEVEARWVCEHATRDSNYRV